MRMRRDLESADVVVTGGTGATGSFVVGTLVQRGYSVAVVGREESASAVGGAGVTFVPGDLRDCARLESIARHSKAIVHAACTFVTPEVDIAAMESLVRGWRSGPFVFISSIDVYGAPQQGIVDELTGAAAVRSSYGVGKEACETLLRSRAASRGTREYTILRPAHVWGPHPRFRSQLEWGDLRWLVRPVMENTVVRIPGPTPAAARRFGDAWIDVRDLARAAVESLERPSGEVINVVGGHFSWYDLVHLLSVWLDSECAIELCDPTRCNQATSWRYSSERLGRVLGIRPRRHYLETLQEVLSQPSATAADVMLGAGNAC